MTKKIILLALISLICTAAMAQNVTFGIISDVHQDLQKDACRRLGQFVDHAQKAQVDFIVSLGDLSHSDGADTVMAVWKKFDGARYNVFGNHDMDHATKKEMVAKYEMPNSYYSFDQNGVHFVVLDCCFTRKDGKLVDYSNGNYYVGSEDRELINDEQIEWLAADLAATKRPSVIFLHTALDDLEGIASSPSKDKVRKVIGQANAATKKVVAVFSGHNHIDAHSQIDGVNYFHINSASYLWVEGSKQYSSGNMAEYRDALYGVVTIDPKAKTITINGCTSEFLPPAPLAADLHSGSQGNVVAAVRDRKVSWK